MKIDESGVSLRLVWIVGPICWKLKISVYRVINDLMEGTVMAMWFRGRLGLGVGVRGVGGGGLHCLVGIWMVYGRSVIVDRVCG